ncbi:sensor histidine kinase [Erythrobacter sp. WG]|uniref:sensor histidine kinase n=1 Tax=Erythrobacter sp. WG TaxID=2985510 RepID=UPI002270C53F|nr:sensor histidine kinase [Erythrobacter sp. WG]MCX9145896.1 sensor histidine kinase [Erythrobacter sp. WG]
MESHVVAYGEYMPHGMCLLWEPWLVLLWAGSDFLIFLSYTAIPFALFLVLRRRTEVPQAPLIALFAAFILLCGITHLLMIVTLWVPIYPFVGWVKLATGLVSMATAIMLFRLVPALVRLPSPAALAIANRDLQGEIAAHQATLASLDQQVRERTAALEAATTALAVQAREAVHRSSNLLAVVHTLAVQSAKGAGSLDAFLPPFLGRLRALADATRAIASEEQIAAPLEKVVAAGLRVLQETYGGRVSASGPALSVNPTAAQHISLALHELATNTLKYGLGAAELGEVEVRWTVDGGEFVFAWREHPVAPGTDANPAVAGFGTMLLTAIVPSTLGGTATRTIEDGALVYRLTAPLATIIARRHIEDDTSLAERIIATSFSG